MASPVSKLPSEMLTHTLKYLPPKDMRAASTVSQSFYNAAHDAGLTLDRRIGSFEHAPLATFQKIIKHTATRRQPFRLGLSIWLLHVKENDCETSVPKLNRMLSSVNNALPYLVTLSIAVPSHLAAVVYAKLDKPAPRLRTLFLSQEETRDAYPVHIPAELFKGDAPCLRDVRLVIPALLPEWPIVPAWNNVRRVRVSRCHREEWLAISRFFPAVQDVELTLGPTPLPLRRVDISGLTLQTLTVLPDELPALIHKAAPSYHAPTTSALRPKIATVKYKGAELHFDPFLWPDSDCALHAQVQCIYDAGRQPPPMHGNPVPDDSLLPTGMTVSVVPENARLCTWRQTQYIVPDEALARGVAVLRLDPLAALGARLVSLAVAEPLLEQLMQAPLTLDGLRDLFVDLTPAPRLPLEQRQPESAHLRMARKMYVHQYHMLLRVGVIAVQPSAERKLRCPALERVFVFATTPLTVAGDRIASLSRLVQGAAGTRVELVLVRVNVEPETEPAALEELFASVRSETASPSSLLAYYHPREDDRVWKLWV